MQHSASRTAPFGCALVNRGDPQAAELENAPRHQAAIVPQGAVEGLVAAQQLRAMREQTLQAAANPRRWAIQLISIGSSGSC